MKDTDVLGKYPLKQEKQHAKVIVGLKPYTIIPLLSSYSGRNKLIFTIAYIFSSSPNHIFFIKCILIGSQFATCKKRSLTIVSKLRQIFLQNLFLREKVNYWESLNCPACLSYTVLIIWRHNLYWKYTEQFQSLQRNEQMEQMLCSKH